MKNIPYQIDPQTCQKMFSAANEVLKNGFPKTYPNHYSCAVLTKKGNIYVGVSYISDTFTLTLHGEFVALAHANLHGESDIIAITGPNCHICKQLIYENSLRSGIDILIITKNLDNSYNQTPVSKLMASPWPEKPTL